MNNIKTKIGLLSLLTLSLSYAAPTNYSCSGKDLTQEEATNYAISYTTDQNNKELSVSTQAEDSPASETLFKNNAVKEQAVNSLTAVNVVEVSPSTSANELEVKIQSLLLPKVVFGIEEVSFKTVFMITEKRINKPAAGEAVNPENQEGLLGALSNSKAINLECTAVQAQN